MKLFILKKDFFDEAMNNDKELSKLVHQRAWRKLNRILDTQKMIPFEFQVDLNIDAVAVFEFKSISKELDVFYYEFKGIAI